jgi:hypothetical protein
MPLHDYIVKLLDVLIQVVELLLVVLLVLLIWHLVIAINKDKVNQRKQAERLASWKEANKPLDLKKE